MADHRHDPTRVPVPVGQDVTQLCVCCTYNGTLIVRDGLYARCKRCNQPCTNVSCRTLPLTARRYYGRFARAVRSRLFR